MQKTTAIRFLNSILLLSACAAPLRPTHAYSQQIEPLPVEELLSARTFAEYMPVDFSPDGEWVAYTLQDNRRKEPPGDERYRVFTRTGVYFYGVGGDIWVSNTKSGQSKNVTGGHGSNWSPAWSPDGRYVAFYSDRSGQASVWVWEKASGKLRQVSNAVVRSLANPIQWTPDARQLAVKLLPEGITLEEAASLLVANQEPTRAERRTNGSTVVVYSSARASSQGGSAKSEAVSPQAPPWNFANRLADLAVIDIASGQIKRIVRGSWIATYRLSSDGSSIAYTTPQKFEATGSQQILFDLGVYSFTTGQPRVVASHIQLDYDGSSVSWSPDGKMLSYRTAGMLAKGDVFVVSATGGEPRKLTAAPHPNFAGFGFQPPLWDAAGKNVFFIGDNALWKASLGDGAITEIARIPRRSIELIAFKGGNRLWSPDGGWSTIISARDDETKQAGFHKINLTTGQSSKLLEESKFYPYPMIYSRAVTDDGQRIIYLAQDTQHGQDLWLADVEFRNVKRVTQINPQLERYRMGSARLIEWRSLDGERLQGALLLPVGYQEGKRYPLIAKVYGDLLSNNLNLFGLERALVDNLQLLSTRGYAVLLPDSPLRVGTPMANLMKTVLPGVDKVVEMGIADPDRLGVMGHSFGGYSTLSLITQTTRFRAAMMSAGFGNMIGKYGQLNKSGASYGVAAVESIYLGGPPWSNKLGYIENSPVFYLDRLQTPLLIIHGSVDEFVPPFLADEVFVGLRRLGKEVVYAKYEDEGHWQGTWSYANQVDFVNRMIAWFDEHLKAPIAKSQAANQ